MWLGDFSRGRIAGILAKHSDCRGALLGLSLSPETEALARGRIDVAIKRPANAPAHTMKETGVFVAGQLTA